MMNRVDAYAAARARNPRGTTTPLVVREGALKKQLLKRQDELIRLVTSTSEEVIRIQMIERELALVMSAQRKHKIDTLFRLVDGVYGGARALLDLLFERHRIDAALLATFNEREVTSLAEEIRAIVAARRTGPRV